MGSAGVVHAQALSQLRIEPNRAEILRYLGYPPHVTPARPLPQSTEDALTRGMSCLSPRGVYSLYDVQSRTAQTLTLGGVTFFGAVAHFLRDARQIAAFVVTVGFDVTEMARTASQQGDMVTAWAYDALGSWAAEATADALMTRVSAHLDENEALTLRYSPGYCGMDVAEQTTLFQLVQAEAIGVTLLPSHLMEPLKSISGLVGIGPADILGESGSPCMNCSDRRCRMRR